MVTEFYKTYLKSEKWKRKREAVFKHYGKRCYACRKPARILHVHHMTYERLGRERMADLLPLCVPCHREVTRLYRAPGGRQKGNQRVTMEFVRAKRKAANASQASRRGNNAPRA